jgi:hypothetical protein
MENENLKTEVTSKGHLAAVDTAYEVGMLLKAQGDLLRGWQEVQHAQLSPESVAGLGDLLKELGERLCNAVLPES